MPSAMPSATIPTNERKVSSYQFYWQQCKYFGTEVYRSVRLSTRHISMVHFFQFVIHRHQLPGRQRYDEQWSGWPHDVLLLLPRVIDMHSKSRDKNRRYKSRLIPPSGFGRCHTYPSNSALLPLQPGNRFTSRTAICTSPGWPSLRGSAKSSVQRPYIRTSGCG